MAASLEEDTGHAGRLTFPETAGRAGRDIVDAVPSSAEGIVVLPIARRIVGAALSSVQAPDQGAEDVDL